MASTRNTVDLNDEIKKIDIVNNSSFFTAPLPKKTGAAKKKYLFIFDFDLTITSRFTPNYLQGHCPIGGMESLIKAEKEMQWEKIKVIPPRGTPERWQNYFKTIIESGNFAAIATLNQFDYLVSRYIQDTIGCSKQQMKKIIFDCHYTKDNKNAHIDRIVSAVKKRFSVKPEDLEIIFVDDDKRHIQAAREKGVNTIEAIVFANENAPPFMDELDMWMEKLKNEAEPVEVVDSKKCLCW